MSPLRHATARYEAEGLKASMFVPYSTSSILRAGYAITFLRMHAGSNNSSELSPPTAIRLTEGAYDTHPGRPTVTGIEPASARDIESISRRLGWSAHTLYIIPAGPSETQRSSVVPMQVD